MQNEIELTIQCISLCAVTLCSQQQKKNFFVNNKSTAFNKASCMYYVNHKRRADTPKEVSNKFQLKVKNNGGVTC